MPLIIISGRPCTGKTTLCVALCESLCSRGVPSRVVSEEECGGGETYSGDRAKVYKAASGEKVSRARFKSVVERHLSEPGLLVIADGCNYSKGFRYELSVLARNARTPSMCLWVGADVGRDAALGVNSARALGERGGSSSSGGSSCEVAVVDASATAAAALVGGGVEGGGGATTPTPYTRESMRELWLRFEPPDPRNRWDSPLLRVSNAGLSPASQARLASAAVKVQLPCTLALRIAALGVLGGEGAAAAGHSSITHPSSWWTPLEGEVTAASKESGGEGGGPFLTSRFSLSQVHTAHDLAVERGGGAVVEALGAMDLRVSRQVADAAAGFGSVPLRGFSAAHPQPVGAFSGDAPDYFAEDFNCDVNSDAEDGVGSGGERRGEGEGEGGGGAPPFAPHTLSYRHPSGASHREPPPDVANLADFEGMGTLHPVKKAGGSSFKRGGAAAAAVVAAAAEAAAAVKGGDGRDVSSNAAVSTAAARALPSPSLAASTLPLFPSQEKSAGASKVGDALEEAEQFIIDFLSGGGSGKKCSKGGEGGVEGEASIAGSALHADAGSGQVIGVVEEGLQNGSIVPGCFVTIPECRALLRCVRVPTLVELHRNKREFLARVEAGSVGPFSDCPSAKKAFVLELNAVLKK